MHAQDEKHRHSTDKAVIQKHRMQSNHEAAAEEDRMCSEELWQYPKITVSFISVRPEANY